MGLTYRLCQEGDEQGLTIFNEKVMAGPSTPEYWTWKYFQNPAGKGGFALALDGNSIVGRVGGIPLRMKAGKNEVLAAQALDTDVMNDYRKGFTYYRLDNMAIEVGREKGVAFVFGFATQSTYDISTKTLGFRHAASVVKWVKLLDPMPFLGKKLRITKYTEVLRSNLRRFAVKKQKPFCGNKGQRLKGPDLVHFDDRFNRLWENSIKGQIAVVRDAEYLNWRYKQCPVADYKTYFIEDCENIKGFVILQVIQRERIIYGYIVDLLVAEEQCIGHLVSAAVQYFRHMGVAAVICWTPKVSLLASTLKKRGFLKRKLEHNIIVKNYCPEKLSTEFLTNEHHWHYSFGDSDLFQTGIRIWEKTLNGFGKDKREKRDRLIVNGTGNG